jgi:hypothetical protein
MLDGRKVMQTSGSGLIPAPIGTPIQANSPRGVPDKTVCARAVPCG